MGEDQKITRTVQTNWVKNSGKTIETSLAYGIQKSIAENLISNIPPAFLKIHIGIPLIKLQSLDIVTTSWASALFILNENKPRPQIDCISFFVISDKNLVELKKWSDLNDNLNFISNQHIFGWRLSYYKKQNKVGYLCVFLKDKSFDEFKGFRKDFEGVYSFNYVSKAQSFCQEAYYELDIPLSRICFVSFRF